MSNEPQITIVGNATNAELKFTNSGKAVCNFRLASTPRIYDKDSGQYIDGETLWLNCVLWGRAGENLIESIGDEKSLRVIVQGRLKSRTYETKEGERRTVFEIDVDEVGPSLTWATARVARNERSGGQQRSQDAPRQAPAQSRTPAQQQAPTGASRGGDPWSTRQTSLTDEPPF